MSAQGAQSLQGFLREWMPDGEQARKFLTHPASVSCIMGPYGSGKTTAAFLKGLLCSAAVPPSPVDGVRYSRGAVVRDTYRNLESNTIPSWEECFPRDVFSFKGGRGGEPGIATLDFALDDGTSMHVEVRFVAVGDHNVKEFCDGLQLTWCFINGLDAQPEEMISYMQPRLSRYPSPQHRPENWKQFVPYWCKLFADMNAPDLDNWTYKMFVENLPKGYAFFQQPGGFDPNAENVKNLRDGYYDNMMAGKEPWWINRFIHNKFGFSRIGEPVYSEYSEGIHISQSPLKFNPDNALILGFDAGRDGRCVALQRTFGGKIRVLAEFRAAQRCAAMQFGQECSYWLADHFGNASRIEAWADPSAVNPSDTSDDPWIEIVSNCMRINIEEAPSNDPAVRIEAVKQPLRLHDDGTPNLLIDPSCMELRKGFSSGYCFGKTVTHGYKIATPVPIKNEFSHVHDALQYGVLGSSDYSALRARGKNRRRTREETNWDPHAHG